MGAVGCRRASLPDSRSTLGYSMSWSGVSDMGDKVEVNDCWDRSSVFSMARSGVSSLTDDDEVEAGDACQARSRRSLASVSG